MSNFNDLISRLDVIGEEILEEYLQNLFDRLKECFNDIHELLPDFIAKSGEHCGGIDELQEALIVPLEEIYDALENSDNGKITIQLQNSADHAAWFGELAGHTAVLRSFEITDSLQAFLDTVDDSDAGQTEA